MGTLFQILGVVFMLILIGILVGGLILWRKFVRPIREILQKGDIPQSPPYKIHLNEDLNPEWVESEETIEIVERLAQLGFEKGKGYTIKEMEGVQLMPFFHPKEGIVSVLYDHPLAGIWIDFHLEYEDNTTLTVSNAPSGGELDNPPYATKIFKKTDNIYELYNTLKEFIEDKPIRYIDQSEFRENMEADYERNMQWRYQKGGVSTEEVKRLALEAGIEMDEADFQEGLKRIKTNELLSWHAECLKTFFRESGMDSSTRDNMEDYLFIVSDLMEPEYFFDYLIDYMDFSDSQYHQFMAMAKDAESSSGLFQKINDSLSKELRAVHAGSVSTPINADIYRAPEER